MMSQDVIEFPLVVEGNGSRLVWLDGVLWYSDLFAVLSQHFEHLFFQSDNQYTHSLLTVCACGECVYGVGGCGGGKWNYCTCTCTS